MTSTSLIRSRFFLTTLIALFIIIQSALQWHATEHYFADDGEVCIVCAHSDFHYFSSSFKTKPSVLWFVVRTHFLTPLFFFSKPFFHYTSRAPPLS